MFQEACFKKFERQPLSSLTLKFVQNCGTDVPNRKQLNVTCLHLHSMWHSK